MRPFGYRWSLRAGVAALTILICTAVAGEEGGAAKVLAKIRALEGEWEGSYAWSGSRSDHGVARARYHITANASAIVEDLFMSPGASPSMTSVYHLDGADLRMTHFCAAQNQPRLRAATIENGAERVRFSFVDGTNLAARPVHVREIELYFVSEHQIVLTFTMGGGAADRVAVERVALERRH